MKSVEELRKLRKKAEKELRTRNNKGKVKIVVGMGTCGIAAGAREIMKEIMKIVKVKDLDILVSQTGCIGMCEKEPLIDVRLPGEPRIIYGNLEPKDISEIINKHVLNGEIVQENLIAKFDE
ncbi:MAG: (2Fe-2S) ferredoxin domain-containing protein [Bacillota bacterium]